MRWPERSCPGGMPDTSLPRRAPPLRVLLYSPVNPADRGGVQAVVRRLTAQLREDGTAVALAWSRADPAGDGNGLMCSLPLPAGERGRPGPRSIAGVARALLRLAVQLASRRPHVVNVHFVTAHTAYFLVLRPLFRYKLVLSAHGSDVLRPKPWNAAWIAPLLRRADAITAVSGPTAEGIQSAGIDPSRIRVIPNGIDHEFWSAARAEVDLAARASILLSVGRLHPVKGHDILLRALAVVRRQVADVRLVLMGGGGGRGDLERLADELQVGDIVEFTGPAAECDIRERMRQARLFVLPSRSEGLPLTLLEAMAAGLPVVASAVGGVPEVLQPGTGTLIPPEDPHVLASVLVALLLDPGRAAATIEPARGRAREFSARTAATSYARLFSRVAAGHADSDLGQPS